MGLQLPRHQAAAFQRSPARITKASLVSFVLIAILALLAACGTQSSSNSSSKIVITEMDYWSIASQSVILNKLFTAYEQLHPNVTIQRDAVPFANLIPKADQEAASHTLPNLIAMDNPDVASFASTGALTQLDSSFPGQLNATNYYAGPLQTTQYKGKTYSMPVGSNDLALYYSIKDFQAAGLTPPTTWAELTADAKALTKGNTFGFAFSATADEEATFQYEPFLWSNQGNLSQIDSPQAVAALQVLTGMVASGSSSKAVLTWNQPDVATQFGEGHAAMMENGPWELPTLEQQYNLKYGTDFGVVQIPVPQSGEKAAVPLGGEEWCVPVSSNSAAVQATIDLVKWLEAPAQLVEFDEGFGYIPALKSAAQTVLQADPELSVFAGEFDTAQARTAQLGANYPKVSQIIWTAMQAALSGSQTAQAALTQAQQQITTALQS
jgi:multiple sugar transport system substrate-binding protein